MLVQYPYPLPLVPAVLKQLRGARYFTELDLLSAYNLIQVKEGDAWKTAFGTSKGHYGYLVLPYGLAMAPSIFQAYINEVLREILGRSIVAYIDDILIYSLIWNQHVRDVRAVLQTLLQNRLYCKAEKCKLHCKEVDFLGYAIQEACWLIAQEPTRTDYVQMSDILKQRKGKVRSLSDTSSMPAYTPKGAFCCGTLTSSCVNHKTKRPQMGRFGALAPPFEQPAGLPIQGFSLHSALAAQSVTLAARGKGPVGNKEGIIPNGGTKCQPHKMDHCKTQPILKGIL
ncbi:hypothetical protein P4O66_000595 [Electrophorus voltai]|uniref:ribonuclease H n=1 Tax=Electrophorus voltai TaxID=2609070 RepID=A0AAD8ZGL9_9TELE|nr:hypothetical protein P4O66_000595 [Electrophorus voltai]